MRLRLANMKSGRDDPHCLHDAHSIVNPRGLLNLDVLLETMSDDAS
jgi:hypothetical protein